MAFRYQQSITVKAVFSTSLRLWQSWSYRLLLVLRLPFPLGACQSFIDCDFKHLMVRDNNNQGFAMISRLVDILFATCFWNFKGRFCHCSSNSSKVNFEQKRHKLGIFNTQFDLCLRTHPFIVGIIAVLSSLGITSPTFHVWNTLSVVLFNATITRETQVEHELQSYQFKRRSQQIPYR